MPELRKEDCGILTVVPEAIWLPGFVYARGSVVDLLTNERDRFKIDPESDVKDGVQVGKQTDDSVTDIVKRNLYLDYCVA